MLTETPSKTKNRNNETAVAPAVLTAQVIDRLRGLRADLIDRASEELHDPDTANVEAALAALSAIHEIDAAIDELSEIPVARK